MSDDRAALESGDPRPPVRSRAGGPSGDFVFTVLLAAIGLMVVWAFVTQVQAARRQRREAARRRERSAARRGAGSVEVVHPPRPVAAAAGKRGWADRPQRVVRTEVVSGDEGGVGVAEEVERRRETAGGGAEAGEGEPELEHESEQGEAGGAEAEVGNEVEDDPGGEEPDVGRDEVESAGEAEVDDEGGRPESEGETRGEQEQEQEQEQEVSSPERARMAELVESVWREVVLVIERGRVEADWALELRGLRREMKAQAVQDGLAEPLAEELGRVTKQLNSVLRKRRPEIVLNGLWETRRRAEAFLALERELRQG